MATVQSTAPKWPTSADHTWTIVHPADIYLLKVNNKNTAYLKNNLQFELMSNPYDILF